MSSEQNDSDGFSAVPLRRAVKKRVHQFESSFELFSRHMEECCDELLISDFYNSLVEALCDVPVTSVKTTDILCYGIGNFITCPSARYQFALLILLRRFGNSKIFIYDPMFTKFEKDYVKMYDMELIEKDENGMRSITKPTLVYMPHCPFMLANNLLIANWGVGLSKIVIVGNSFTKLCTDNTKTHPFKHIRTIFPLTMEIPLDCKGFKYKDIFNDISVHSFPSVECLRKHFLNKSFRYPEMCQDEGILTNRN